MFRLQAVLTAGCAAVLGQKSPPASSKQFHGYAVSERLWAEEDKRGLCSIAENPAVDVVSKYAFGRKGLFTPAEVPKASWHDDVMKQEPDREFSFPALGSMAASAVPLANKLVGSLLRVHLLTSWLEEVCKDGRHDQAPLRLSRHEEEVRRAIGNSKAEFAPFNLLPSRPRWDFIFDEAPPSSAGGLQRREVGGHAERGSPEGLGEAAGQRGGEEALRRCSEVRGGGPTRPLPRGLPFDGDAPRARRWRQALCGRVRPSAALRPGPAQARRVAAPRRDEARRHGVCAEHTKLLPVYARGLETLHVDDGAAGNENGIYDIWPPRKRNGAFMWKQRLGWEFIHRQSDGSWQLDDHRWGGHGYAISNEQDEDWPDVVTWATLDTDFKYRDLGGRAEPSWVSRWDLSRPIRMRNASAPKSPDQGRWLAELEGTFDPVPGAAANGWPVWQRRGQDAFISATSDGYWMLSDGCWKWGCDEGNLTTDNWSHGAPPSMKKWQYGWYDESGADAWSESGARFDWIGGEGKAPQRLYAETFDGGTRPVWLVLMPALVSAPGLLFLAWRRRERPAPLLGTEGCA